jgi:hypothetical protein
LHAGLIQLEGMFDENKAAVTPLQERTRKHKDQLVAYLG